MQNFLPKLPEQLVRLIIVLLVIILGIIVLRFIILPDALVNSDYHRTATIERESAKDIKYAGSEVCKDCHADKSDLKKNGYHKNLACETCHGPAKEHIDNPTEKKPTVEKERAFCQLCHTYDLSRPTGFPQIDPKLHNPMKPCASCHNPHDPKPPATPEECSACHAQIAKTKSVSHHVNIDCTICHNAPAEHKISPRTVKPTKPENREFCGQCHDQALGNADIPSVDISTHGEKYVCWQCHYPHMPEVR